MSQTIQGSKSSLYDKDPVAGVANSIDYMSHLSVQNLWNGRGAADVLMHGLSFVTGATVAIESGSVRRKIKITAHGAKAGEFIKMTNGTAIGEEVAIIRVIDANFFVIAKEINAAVGDLLYLMRPVTPRFNADGSISASISTGGLATDANQLLEIAALGQNITTPSPAMPAGGVGILGWLSAIWTKLNSSISVAQTASIPTYAESLLIDNLTVVTLAAPVGVKGCKIITPTSNSGSIPLHVTLDGVTSPSSTVGMEIQAGRSEDFIGVGSLKVIAKSAITAQKISVHWYV